MSGIYFDRGGGWSPNNTVQWEMLSPRISRSERTPEEKRPPADDQPLAKKGLKGEKDVL